MHDCSNPLHTFQRVFWRIGALAHWVRSWNNAVIAQLIDVAQERVGTRGPEFLNQLSPQGAALFQDRGRSRPATLQWSNQSEGIVDFVGDPCRQQADAG